MYCFTSIVLLDPRSPPRAETWKFRGGNGQSRASGIGGDSKVGPHPGWWDLARGLRKRGHSEGAGLSSGISPARETLPGPAWIRAHLRGQGWGLQVSTAAGCWASALHREWGTVLRRPPWASTQRTTRSRRPPPQEALHGPKSPAAQLRRGTEHRAPGRVPRLAQGRGREAGRSV